jgi:bis(5'-adenosyl)-triphosphatase
MLSTRTKSVIFSLSLGLFGSGFTGVSPFFIRRVVRSNIVRRQLSAMDCLFGKFHIPEDTVFLRTESTFAFVNLRPIVPGHVLVCPVKIVPKLEDLSDEEYKCLWLTVRTTQKMLKDRYNCSAFNVAVQDGRAAGQSVPHVHVHILPRVAGDYERNDDVYDHLNSWAPKDELKVDTTLEVAEDKDRKDRTRQEMTDEAADYRSLILNSNSLPN